MDISIRHPRFSYKPTFFKKQKPCTQKLLSDKQIKFTEFCVS